MIHEPRPTIFAEENRAVWMIVSRFLVYLLKQSERWYQFGIFKGGYPSGDGNHS